MEPFDAASIDVAALASELTKLRTRGLRRRKDRPSLPVLESVGRAIGGDATAINAKVKVAIEAGSNQMAEVRAYAIRELLDAGSRKDRYLYQRRPHIADKLAITLDHLENTVEAELIDELARHLARLVAEQAEKEVNAQPTTPAIDDANDGDTQLDGNSRLDDGTVRGSVQPTRQPRGRLVDAIAVSIVLVGMIVAIGWQVHRSSASSPTAMLPNLKEESERELTGDQAPAYGDASRTLGFGDPESQGRVTYPYVSHNSKPGEPGYGSPSSPTPTLDVLTDVPHGTEDERKFLHVMVGTAKRPHAVEIGKRSLLAQSSEYVWLRIYIDNGAYPEPDCNKLAGPTIARHTSVRVATWDSPDRRLHIIRAWVYSENATPKWITDAVAVVTTQPRHLQLVPALSTQYSEVPDTFLSHPPFQSAALVEPAGMLLGGEGLLGSCWKNRFVVLPVFRQVT